MPPPPPPPPPPPRRDPSRRAPGPAAAGAAGASERPCGAVCLCERAKEWAPRLSAEAARLWNGTTLHRVERSDGMRLLVQLPVCYAPAGVLRDFDGGLRLPACPETASGRAAMSELHGLCRGLLEAAAAPGDRAGAAGLPAAGSPSGGWAATSSANPVRPGGEAALLKNRREWDCCFFDPAGAPLRDDEGCPLAPGDRFVPLVCVEHLWVREARGAAPGDGPRRRAWDPHTWRTGPAGAGVARPGGPGGPGAAGVTLKVLQVMVVTETSRFGRRMLLCPGLAGLPAVPGRAPGPGPGPGGRAPAALEDASGADPRETPGQSSGAGRAPPGDAGWGPSGSKRPPARREDGRRGSRSWVPSVSDISAAISRLRKTAPPQ